MTDYPTIALDTARELLDFTGGDVRLANLAEMQLEGCVALQNMLATQDVAYLADEVGMGKTYVALGVVALLRHLNPHLKVLYLTPKNNVREKWARREYPAFVRHNYRVSDLRFRNFDKSPALTPKECFGLQDLLMAVTSGPVSDLFVCTSAFSFALGESEESLQGYVRGLKTLVPALARELDDLLASRRDPKQLKEDVKWAYASAINRVLPVFDLVIVDEAHYFKGGLSDHGPWRNRILGHAIGTHQENQTRRVKKVLLLSATPFDRDPRQLSRQLDVFGQGAHFPEATAGGGPAEDLYARLQSFMVRRLNELELRGQRYTRNQYRTEHRCSEQARIDVVGHEQQLFTALLQKRVLERLRRDFGGSYQTGLMASFETYLPPKVREAANAGAETAEGDAFDGGDDGADEQARKTPDSDVVTALVKSYEDAFEGRTPPHPKLDSVCRRIHQEGCGGRGHKTLVFVRRIRSVDDLKRKLERAYDESLLSYLKKRLAGTPSLSRLEHVYSIYREVARQPESPEPDGSGPDPDDIPPKNDNFFTWFFRGKPHQAITGVLDAEFRAPDELRKALVDKDREESVWFEFNWARWLSRRVDEPLNSQLIAAIEKLVARESQPRRQWSTDFRAIQAAYFLWLARRYENTPVGRLAYALFHHYGGKAALRVSSSADVRRLLEYGTVFTLLDESGDAAQLFSTPQRLWKISKTGDASEEWLEAELKRLEIHRELFFTHSRVDHPMIDLYLAWVGSDKLKSDVPSLFVDVLNRQGEDHFSSRMLFSRLNSALDLVIKTNFAELMSRRPDEYRRAIAQLFNQISPVAGATGATVKGRPAQARRFRMAGYPLTMVSTDVFQEGEDLHLFCDRVVHYGVTGNPIAVEQKNGRVDRVGALAHRNLQACDDGPLEDNFIQVVFPHISDSIEAFQIRQLASDLNEYTRSLHRIDGDHVEKEERINPDDAAADISPIPAAIKATLKSPFPAVPERGRTESVEAELNALRKQISEKVAHVQDIAARLKQELTESGSEGLSLRASHYGGEMILSVTNPANEQMVVTASGEWLDELKALYCRSYRRTVAREISRNVYSLSWNSELLVADPEWLDEAEVGDLLFRAGRLSRGAKPPTSPVGTARALVKATFSPRNQKSASWFVRMGVRVKRNYDDSLEYELIDPVGREKNRKQGICWRISDEGYLVLESTAASAATVEMLIAESPTRLVEFTLLRNAFTDMVDFGVSEAGTLVGRVVHPLVHLEEPELCFMACALAREVDRLEYIMSNRDFY